MSACGSCGDRPAREWECPNCLLTLQENYCWECGRTLSETGPSAAVADTAFTGEQAAPRATASASSVSSETVGERQGWHPVSLSVGARGGR